MLQKIHLKFSLHNEGRFVRGEDHSVLILRWQGSLFITLYYLAPLCLVILIRYWLGTTVNSTPD